MMPKVRIRRAEAPDIPELSRIEAVCIPQPWSEKQLLEALSSDLVLLAEEDGVIAGFLEISTVLDEGNLNSLAVLPQYRRKGIARALLNEAETLLLPAVCRLMLEVRQENTGARALYEAMGFRIDGVRKGFYHDPPDDAVLMSKYLNAKE